MREREDGRREGARDSKRTDREGHDDHDTRQIPGRRGARVLDTRTGRNLSGMACGVCGKRGAWNGMGVKMDMGVGWGWGFMYHDTLIVQRRSQARLISTHYPAYASDSPYAVEPKTSAAHRQYHAPFFLSPSSTHRHNNSHHPTTQRAANPPSPRPPDSSRPPFQTPAAKPSSASAYTAWPAGSSTHPAACSTAAAPRENHH